VTGNSREPAGERELTCDYCQKVFLVEIIADD
jgi:hypothetical protein